MQNTLCGINRHLRARDLMLEPHHPMFIEELLLSEHPEGIKALSQLTTTPIALGERLHSRWDVKPYLESAALDILQPDVCHAGGISETRRIAVMCRAYHVALAPHCPLGPIALAPRIQVDAVSASFTVQEMSLGIHYNAGLKDLTSYLRNLEVWDVREGMIDLPSRPGLGIEIDEVREGLKRRKGFGEIQVLSDPVEKSESDRVTWKPRFFCSSGQRALQLRLW
jgi:galactonate dehydratase